MAVPFDASAEAFVGSPESSLRFSRNAVDSNEQQSLDWGSLLMQATCGDEGALQQLRPLLEYMANWIARSNKRPLRDELVENALSIIWEALHKDKALQFGTSNAARAWCRKVLRNALIDRDRHEGILPVRQEWSPRLEDEANSYSANVELDNNAERGWTSFWNRVMFELDLREPFSEEDVRLIEGWGEKCRIYLLCLAGLWHKVPEKQHRRWLREAGLPGDFPPLELFECESAVERSRLLADATGSSVNSFHKVWSQHKNLLRELAFIKERSPSVVAWEGQQL
jgi:hypothetical protein